MCLGLRSVTFEGGKVVEVTPLLNATLEHGASDLHLQVDSPPVLRINGIPRLLEAEPLSKEDMESLARDVLARAGRTELPTTGSLDFSVEFSEEACFRVNLFYQRGTLAMVLRAIPLRIPTFEELNLPPVIRDIAGAERGLVLVTGTTGSGKSTTLAAIIDYINSTRPVTIITIEDPIEYIHTNKKGLVAQREVGRDTPGFDEALRRVLRQDPDIILVGELRDLESMRVAIRAADTGHLVLSTVHTTNATQTVERVIALFPQVEHELLLTQLSSNLEAVISQRLARTADGKERIPALEIMRGTPVVQKLILEGRISSLPQALTSRDLQMCTFDQYLCDLYNTDTITGTEALRLASNAESLSLMLRGITSTEGGIIT